MTVALESDVGHEPELWGIRNTAVGSSVQVRCFATRQQAEKAAAARTDNYSAFEVVPLFLLPNVAGNRLARQGQSELTGVLGARNEEREDGQ